MKEEKTKASHDNDFIKGKFMFFGEVKSRNP